MKWSKFNHIMECKYGIFIYNSTTNSFLKISQRLREKITSTIDWTLGIEEVEPELKQVFIKNRIVVADDFDEKYLTKLKFIYHRAAFADSRLLLTIATTTACNFKCPYCYEGGISHASMDEETEKAVIRYIDSIKPRKLTIGWYGGEPLLNFGTIERLTNEIERLDYIDDLQFSIVTNASLLTEERCLFFKEHRLNNVQVTLDGCEARHNQSRMMKNGEPTYATILHNLDRALELLPECHFSVRVNITKSNQEDYPLLYRQLHERYKDKRNFSVYFSFVEDYNLSGSPDVMNPKERMEFLHNLEQSHHIHGKIYPTREDCLCTACMINSFVVAPNGDLYKCWNEIGRKDFVLGNIKESKVIKNHDLICEYAIDYNKFSDPKCMACFLLPVCSGGCPYYRYSNQTRDTHLPICPYNFEYIDSALEMMYERTQVLPQKP